MYHVDRSLTKAWQTLHFTVNASVLHCEAVELQLCKHHADL